MKSEQNKVSKCHKSYGKLLLLEKDLLKQIVGCGLHANFEFTQKYGLSRQQHESTMALEHFKVVFIQFYSRNRLNSDYLNSFHATLEKFFQANNIVPGTPSGFYLPITLGMTLLIRHNIDICSSDPCKQFSQLLDKRMRLFFIRAYRGQSEKYIFEQQAIFEELFEKSSDIGLQYISGICDLSLMIHIDCFPSQNLKLIVNGEVIEPNKHEQIKKKKFFHLYYSNTYRTYYDLRLKQEDSHLANWLPFINKQINVFRENCDELLKVHYELSTNQDKLEPVKKISQIKKNSLEQKSIYFQQMLGIQAPSKKVKKENKLEKEPQEKKQMIQEVNQPYKKQMTWEVKQPDPDQMTWEVKHWKKLQLYVKINRVQLELILERASKTVIDKAKEPYYIKNNLLDLVLMQQGEIVKRLQKHYGICLKPFMYNTRYLEGLLVLSCQWLSRQQNETKYDFSHSQLLGFDLQVTKYVRKGKVKGSILGFEVYKYIQLPEILTMLLYSCLGPEAIIKANPNSQGIYVCATCHIFDKEDHICELGTQKLK